MPAPSLPPSHARLLSAFAAYEAAAEGLARPTVRNHRIYLEAYLRWWQATRPGQSLHAATTADLADFIVAEAARGLSPRTWRAQVAALRRFWVRPVLTGPQLRLSPSGRGGIDGHPRALLGSAWRCCHRVRPRPTPAHRDDAPRLRDERRRRRRPRRTSRH